MAEKDKAGPDFIDSWEANETPPAETVKEPAQEEAATAPKSETGEPDAQQQAEPANPEKPAPDQPKFPPKEGKEPLTEKEVVALIEMRRKADDAERRADDAERRAQFYEQQQQREAEKPAPPDMLDEPEKFRDWQNRQMQDALLNERMNTTELIARQQHGDAKVDAALAAIRASNDQAARERMLTARNPYGELMKWHVDHAALSEIREAGGIDALIEKRIAERLKTAPATQQQAASPPVMTPPSLAKAGNNGAKATSSDRQSDAEFFSSVFHR